MTKLDQGAIFLAPSSCDGGSTGVSLTAQIGDQLLKFDTRIAFVAGGIQHPARHVLSKIVRQQFHEMLGRDIRRCVEQIGTEFRLAKRSHPKCSHDSAHPFVGGYGHSS